MTSKAANKFSPEVRARAVRLVVDTRASTNRGGRRSTSIASKIGCTPQTLRNWGRQAERDRRQQAGDPDRDRPTRLKALKRENRELRQAQRDPAQGDRLFCARRSSTAGRSHGRVHRPASRRARGRADLQGAIADRPVEILRACGQTRANRRGCRRAATPDDALEIGGSARVRGEFPGLRRAQSLAAAASARASMGPAARSRG